MTTVYKESTVVLSEVVSVEEAEDLLEWLHAHPKGMVDLYDCVHLHTAVLQVLMAARPSIASWPKDAAFGAWLKAALNDEKKEY